MSPSDLNPHFEMQSTSQRWFGVRVKTRKEAFSSAALDSRGYECFSPTYNVRRRWSDRVKEVPEALFPGYVFCRFEVQRRVPILTAPGVIEIVGVGRTPEPIPDEEIWALQRAVKLCSSTSPWPYLSAGQKVRIESGPMAGTEGGLVKVKNASRLILSVHLLQRSVSLELDEQHVAPLSPPNPFVLRSRHLSI